MPLKIKCLTFVKVVMESNSWHLLQNLTYLILFQYQNIISLCLLGELIICSMVDRKKFIRVRHAK